MLPCFSEWLVAVSSHKTFEAHQSSSFDSRDADRSRISDNVPRKLFRGNVELMTEMSIISVVVQQWRMSMTLLAEALVVDGSLRPCDVHVIVSRLASVAQLLARFVPEVAHSHHHRNVCTTSPFVFKLQHLRRRRSRCAIPRERVGASEELCPAFEDAPPLSRTWRLMAL